MALGLRGEGLRASELVLKEGLCLGEGLPESAAPGEETRPGVCTGANPSAHSPLIGRQRPQTKSENLWAGSRCDISIGPDGPDIGTTQVTTPPLPGHTLVWRSDEPWEEMLTCGMQARAVCTRGVREMFRVLRGIVVGWAARSRFPEGTRALEERWFF